MPLTVFLSEFRQNLVTRWRVLKRAANYPESWLLSALLYVVLPVLGFYALARNGGYLNVPYVLVLLAALWLLVLTEIQRWSLRIALPIATLLVIWGVILSAAGWNYRHQIRTLATVESSETPGEITNVFSKWLNSRDDQLLYSHRPYPIILVAAEGGGIRAAFITAEFLNLLRIRDNSFSTHLFAISGVSGGSVGGTIFAAGCKAAQKNGAIVADMPRRVLSERNFLSGPISALLGPEILQKLLPMHAPWLSPIASLEKICIDRASLLEMAFEDAFESVTGSKALTADYYTEYHPTENVPLLLLNTTDAATGRRVVLTPATFQSSSETALYIIPVNTSPHLAFSTAAFLSSRFPILSPAGDVYLGQKRKLTLVDGGYIDNTGTVTLAELMFQLLQSPQAQPFSLIVLVPKFGDETVREKMGIPGNFESLPIVDALLNSQGQLSSSSDKLTLFMRTLADKVPCLLAEIRLNASASVPLGWCLTKNDTDILEKALKTKFAELDRAEAFPPKPLDLRVHYLKTVDIDSQQMQLVLKDPKVEAFEYLMRETTLIPLGWPDLRNDPGVVPRVCSIRAADLPEWMQKWCGVSPRSGDEFFAQDGIDELKAISDARMSVLEDSSILPAYKEQMERLVSKVVKANASGFGGGDIGKDLDVVGFFPDYEEYLQYVHSVTMHVSPARSLEGWMAKLDERCKTRWQTGLEN